MTEESKKLCDVEFALSALDDLQDILDWYASQQVPQVGERLVAAIIKHVEQLEEFPDSGKVVPEFEMEWLRELELRPFRIVYRHIGGTVSIARFKRAERLMDPGLGGNA